MSAAERLDPDLVLYRLMQESDAPFVFSSWMRWARANAPLLRSLSDRAYWSDRHGYRAHVESLVKRSQVLVACDPECPEMIFGYAVAEPPKTLHFVFVTRDMRQRAEGRLPQSIGGTLVRSLIPAFGREETTATLDRPAFALFAKRHKLGFDPLAVPLAGEWFKQWCERQPFSYRNSKE